MLDGMGCYAERREQGGDVECRQIHESESRSRSSQIQSTSRLRPSPSCCRWNTSRVLQTSRMSDCWEKENGR